MVKKLMLPYLGATFGILLALKTKELYPVKSVYSGIALNALKKYFVLIWWF